MNVSNSPKVFVSYSTSVEEKTGIVKELKGLCQQRDIVLIQDSETLKHGASIKKFMDELSGGEHVITVFSQAYFESKWCMYELLRIFRRGDFEQRTHPVLTEDCDLQDSDYRLKVVDFWGDKFKVEESKLEGREAKLILPEHEQVKIYCDIYQNISELLNFAAGRVTTPLLELKNKNYSQLLDNIKLEKKDDSPEPISDEDFLQQIRLGLAEDLEKSGFLKEHLLDKCNLDLSADQEFHDYLIDQCVKGQFVDVIQNLESAFVDSYDSMDGNDTSAINKLYGFAEDILYKLVLFNIKNEWMMQFHKNGNDLNQHVFTFPEMSLGSVQLVSSRQSGTLPKLQIDLDTLEAKADDGFVLESGIKSDDVFGFVIKGLYSIVFDRELPTDINEKTAISKLQKRIHQRKIKPNLKLRKNYFLLIPNDNQHSGLEDQKVQKKLKELFPDLSLIRIKSDCSDDIFIVEDEELMVAISEFFNTLESHKTK